MKYISAILIFCLFCIPGQSQFWELGVRGGISNYQGDLSPVAFTISETHLAGGAFLRMNFNEYFSLRANTFFGTISGDDQNFNDDRVYKRNLSFRSPIFEVSLLPEFYFTGINNCNKIVSPYIFAGIAMFNFSPEANYKGQWIELQPLGTEGQGTSEFPDREKYELTQFSIPFGAGVKIATKSGFNIGLETSFRKTFTDYLDDVSRTYADPVVLATENGTLSPVLSNRTGEVNEEPFQYDGDSRRGDPNDMDWYLSAEILLSYTIGGGCGTGNGRNNSSGSKKSGCPVW